MNKTISQLEEKLDLKDSDVLLVENEEGTYKVSKANLLKEVIKEQESLKQSVSNGKSLIASAITDKGVVTSNEDTFAAIAGNIAKIEGSLAGDYKTVQGVNKIEIPISNKGVTKNFSLKANSTTPIGVAHNDKFEVPVKITNGLESTDDRFIEKKLNLSIPYEIYAYNNGVSEVSNEIAYNVVSDKFEFKRNIDIGGSENWFGTPFVTFPYSEKVSLAHIAYNKGKLYILGYSTSSRYSSPVYDCYSYDLKTREWKKLKSCPAFYHNAAVVTLNDKIYTIAGTNGEQSLWGQLAYEYDIETDTWREIAATISLPTNSGADIATFGGRFVQAVTYKNKIYLIGSSGVSAYSQETGKWEIVWNQPEVLAGASFRAITVVGDKAYIYTSAAKFFIYDFISKEMTIEDTGFNIGTSYINSYYSNGTIYYCSADWLGKSFCTYNVKTKEWKQISHRLLPTSESNAFTFDGKDNIYFFSDTNPKINIYNTSYNTFDVLAPISTNRAGMGSCVVDKSAYCIGGYNDKSTEVNTNEYYDIETDSWKSLANMPTARRDLIVEHLEGKLYAMGGNANTEYFKKLECYDIAKNTWSALTEMPVAKTGMGSVLYNNKIYLFGGKNESGYLTSVECYDIAENTWETISTNLPVAKAYFNCLLIEDKVYIVGGRNEECLTSVECYDITKNTWKTCTSMKNARYGALAGVLNGSIYVASGYNDTDYLHSVECYHPETDSWVDSLDIEEARIDAGYGVINNRLYVFGGHNSKFTNLTNFFTSFNVQYLNDVIELEGDYNLPITLGNCIIEVENAKNAVITCDVPILRV